MRKFYKMNSPADTVKQFLKQMRLQAVSKNLNSYDGTAEQLLDFVKSITQTVDPSAVWSAYKLTSSEQFIADFLHARMGRAVHKDTILDAVYYLELEPPEVKIVDVFICKIRKKLERYNAPYKIVTLWGVGFKMELKDAENSIGISGPHDGKNIEGSIAA